MMTLKLESDISAHPYTGWTATGRVLIECSEIASAIRHGAEYVRDNDSRQVWRIVDGHKKIAVKPEYVNACIACGSLEHKTYSKQCKHKSAHNG